MPLSRTPGNTKICSILMIKALDRRKREEKQKELFVEGVGKEMKESGATLLMTSSITGIDISTVIFTYPKDRQRYSDHHQRGK